ncbi:hypothetical protein [Zhaonella formicivorans]|uniref:hypothetical protein n=1 Tax=Zhaonella formicivorans TaxID=2528593 RepID=UPI0010CE0A76|nr:hypothetical protein [Zhaonella formicivorans]
MSQPDKRYKIAVVEDNKMNAELLEAFLVSKGYQVQQGKNSPCPLGGSGGAGDRGIS